MQDTSVRLPQHILWGRRTPPPCWDVHTPSRSKSLQVAALCKHVQILHNPGSSTPRFAIDNSFTLSNLDFPPFPHKHTTDSRSDPWGAILAGSANTRYNPIPISCRTPSSRRILGIT